MTENINLVHGANLGHEFIESEIKWRGYKWLFYEDFNTFNLDERIVMFGEYNSKDKMFSPDLRWFFGSTVWVRWSAFRNDKDAVQFKLAFGDKAIQWKGDL